MPLSEMFNPKMKTMTGKVIVTESENPFGKGSPVMHVVRSTADDAVIAAEMSKYTDVVKAADMIPVMRAFVSALKDALEHGNAVRISGLGTLYIKASTDAASPAIDSAAGATQSAAGGAGTSDIDFSVGFTPAKDLCEAAKKAEAALVKASETKPQVESVQNMDTMEENTLTSGKVAMINGRRLRIAGDADDTGAPADGTGLFMVPCDADGNYKADKSDWVRVKSKDIGRNVMTQAVFRVPKGLKGKYRIAIFTRAPLSGCTKKELLIKKARGSVSRVFDME